MSKRVLITNKIPQSGIALLEKSGCILTIHDGKNPLNKDELIRLGKQHDAILSVGANQLNHHFFEQCHHLKGIALMSVGFDNVDITAANHFGVAISNTPDVLSKATSDIAFLLMLAVSRNAFYMHKKIEQGEWKPFEPTANLGIELYGKTLGIFGMGRIGIELATKATAAYGMKIIYHNRSKNTEAEKLLNATYVSFDQLLAQSDVISVHANLSAETKEIFNGDAFKKMKPTSIFINTARGGIHHEDDLITAIKNKTIWGTGLDVTNPEPMQKDNPLLNLPHVCVLPHIGSATVETRDKMAIMAAENIIAALNNQKMPQVINREIYSN
jgi:glyoxylate reductase